MSPPIASCALRGSPRPPAAPRPAACLCRSAPAPRLSLQHRCNRFPPRSRFLKGHPAGKRPQLMTARCAAAATSGAGNFALSSGQVASFERDGYLVLEGFASPGEVQALRSRMGELISGFDPSTVSIFSTKNQKEVTDDYFLDSGNNISFFFEEGAFDEQGDLAVSKELAINKVGHALHDLDPAFRSFSRSPKMLGAMRSLGFDSPMPVQSMYICKQPSIGGEVVPHQDNSFLYTSPPTCMGLWLALEDATQENGCLWALPDSHRHGIDRRMTVAEGSITFDKPPPDYDLGEFVPIEVASGSLVLLHGSNVHMSYENTSDKSRHAYTMHVVEGGGGAAWAPDNWLQRRPGFPFEPMS